MNEVEYFEECYRLFSEETCHMSFTATDNENYQRIIKLGKTALPLLFNKLREEPNFNLFSMIQDIAKENIKIPLRKRGKLYKVTEEFLKWGKEHDY